MTTTTRRKLIAGAAALPLLPVSAFATPVEEGPRILNILDDLEGLPPEPREVAERMIHLLAEKYRGLKAGVPS